MSAIYEITDITTTHVSRTHWYMEVQHETEASDCQMEAAGEAVIDSIADDVWSDLDPLIEGWIDRYGERYKNDLKDAVKEWLERNDEDYE